MAIGIAIPGIGLPLLLWPSIIMIVSLLSFHYFEKKQFDLDCCRTLFTTTTN